MPRPSCLGASRPFTISTASGDRLKRLRPSYSPRLSKFAGTPTSPDLWTRSFAS